MVEIERRSVAELFAFHGTLLVLGALFAYPVLALLVAQLGLGSESEALARMSYPALVGFGLFSLMPWVIAFGAELRFSPYRFAVGVGLIALVYLSRAIRPAYIAEATSLLIPLGGGLTGFPLAMLLGYGGLAVYRRMQASRGWRLGVSTVFAIVLMGVVGAGVGEYLRHRAVPIEAAMTGGQAGDVRVEGSGRITKVERFGPPYDASRRLAHIQAVWVALTDKREVMLVEYPKIKTGIEADLHELAPGQTVRFAGLLRAGGSVGGTVEQEIRRFGGTLNSAPVVEVSSRDRDIDWGYIERLR